MKKTTNLMIIISLLSFATIPQLLTYAQVQHSRMIEEEFAGTLEIKYEDPVDGQGRQVYYLNTGKERLELRFNAGGSNLAVGSRLRVRGQVQAGTLNVKSSSVVEAAQMSPALGEQRQLVMLFNFQDQPTNRPWTASYIQDLLFNQINQYYSQVSYGQTWITGDFTGWYTASINSTDCQANLTLAAENGARALGYNPDNYSHKIYIFPSQPCGSTGGTTWTSTDSAGNFKTWIYINGAATSYIMTHEFGHSLGFQHSNSLNCNGVTYGTNCSHVEYGDNYDVMGYYNTGVPNAYHSDLANWLGSRIQTVSSDGTFTLTPMSIADANLKALRVLKSYDATTDSTTYYYIEYRQPVGYDSFLSSYPAITNGVLIRIGTIGNDLNKTVLGSELLDLTPTVSGRNEALAVGRSYSDPAIPFTVTVLGANSSGATVQVQFATLPCSHSNPTVAITPQSSVPVAPGTPVTYTVTVVNNDSTNCVASNFNLQSFVPSGWTASFANPTLSVNPGASASTNLQVTSPTGATSGSYTFSVLVSNSSYPSYSASTSAVYVVATSLSVAASTDRGSYNHQQAVSMTSNVSASGSPVAGASVSYLIIKPNGTTVTQSAMTGTNGVATIQYRPKKQDPSGTYQIRETATKNGVQGTGNTSFVLQ
jgi:hypothetical protein